MLTGQLLVLSLQAALLHRWLPVTEAQRVHALLDGYRGWLIAAGMVAVLLAAATARANGRRRDATSGPEPGSIRALTETEIPQGEPPVSERTLVLVKPDGVRRGVIGEVVSRIERRA